jgi:hypothetical protein
MLRRSNRGLEWNPERDRVPAGVHVDGVLTRPNTVLDAEELSLDGS